MSRRETHDSKSTVTDENPILLRPYPVRRTPSRRRIAGTYEIVHRFLEQHRVHLPADAFVTLLQSRYISDYKTLFVFSSALNDDRCSDVFNAVCTYHPQQDTTNIRWIGYIDDNAQQRWLQQSKIAFLFHDRKLIQNLIPKRREQQITSHLSLLNEGVTGIILDYCYAPVDVFTDKNSTQKLGLMKTQDFAGSLVHRLTKQRYLHRRDRSLCINAKTVEKET